MQRADDIRAAFCHAKNLCNRKKNNTPKPKVTTAPPAVLPKALVPVVPQAEAAVRQLPVGCASGKYAGLGAHHAYTVAKTKNPTPPIRPTKVAAVKAATIQVKGRASAQVKGRASAQVALSVEQQVVEQKSGGLKPEESKPFRIAARLSENERIHVVRQAEIAGLTISDYFRASILKPEFVSNIDPVKRELLQRVSKELNRQGTNLNQIAKHLNDGTAAIEEGNSMLAIIARSLLSAHASVRNALAEGRSMP